MDPRTDGTLKSSQSCCHHVIFQTLTSMIRESQPAQHKLITLAIRRKVPFGRSIDVMMRHKIGTGTKV